jgi:CheY-like chemotaxis protein
MSPTILVIDDDPAVLTMMTDWLTEAGFTVIPTGDGTEALEALRGGRIDVMVADILMPRPDGWDLLDELRRTQASTQTVIVTGCLTEVLHREAERRGARLVLEKPFPGAQLVAAVTEAVVHATSRRTGDRLVQADR